MDDVRLRGVLTVDRPDGGQIGTIQPKESGWHARHFPSLPGWTGSFPMPTETIHPTLDAARSWLLAQPQPPRLGDLMPGVERFGGLIVRPIFAAEELRAVQVLGGLPSPETFLQPLPPVGKRGIPHPSRHPGLLLFNGIPPTQGPPKYEILLIWANHGETGVPVAWKSENRRRGAVPLHQALLQEGEIYLASAHARLAWRAFVESQWPAWPAPNPFEGPR